MRRIKRALRRILMLGLMVLMVVMLYRHFRKPGEEDPEAGPLDLGAIAVMSINDEVNLGTITDNPDGGIRIDVVREEGKVYSYIFHDVSKDSWYADAVNFAVSARLMTGAGDEPYFQPEYGMVRESFAAILYRFAGGSAETPHYTFDDVEKDKWYYDIIGWVANRRLMTGLEPTVFGVGQYMTCEQALIGLYRLAGEPETDGSLADYPYAMKVSDVARNAVDWAWKNGLITEVECVWYPTQAISRAQIALLLMRYSIMSAAAEKA